MADGAGASAAGAAVRRLLDSKLVLVTGKGGTGKTTFSSSLALLAAAQGRRVLLAEMDSQRPAFTAVFGSEPPFEPLEVRERLCIANLTWPEALQSFLAALVPSRRVVRLILSNRMVKRFLDFTPGSQEIVLLSALAEQVEHFDLVVADLPASGHAFSLLDITRSALGLFRSGPVRSRAEELRALIRDGGTRLAFVALPEEMVVNETIETVQRMRSFELLSNEPTVFLNRALPPTYTGEELALLEELGSQDLSELEAEYLRAGRWEAVLEQSTSSGIERLTEELGYPPVLVPPSSAGDSARRVVGHVAVHLGRSVGVSRRSLQWEA